MRINTEVEIMENIDYGDTDLRSVIEGDHDYNRGEENIRTVIPSRNFHDGDLVDVDESNDSDDDGYVDLDESLDSGDEE